VPAGAEAPAGLRQSLAELRDPSRDRSVGWAEAAKHQAALAVICQPCDGSAGQAAATGFDKCAVLAFR